MPNQDIRKRSPRVIINNKFSLSKKWNVTLKKAWVASRKIYVLIERRWKSYSIVCNRLTLKYCSKFLMRCLVGWRVGEIKTRSEEEKNSMFLIYSFFKDRVHVLVISALSAFISVPGIITVFKINVCTLIRFGLICHISIGKEGLLA